MSSFVCYLCLWHECTLMKQKIKGGKTKRKKKIICIKMPAEKKMKTKIAKTIFVIIHDVCCLKSNVHWGLFCNRVCRAVSHTFRPHTFYAYIFGERYSCGNFSKVHWQLWFLCSVFPPLHFCFPYDVLHVCRQAHVLNLYFVEWICLYDKQKYQYFAALFDANKKESVKKVQKHHALHLF